MDSNQNNFKGFKFDFGKGAKKETTQGSSKGFKDNIKTRDSNRKGKNPFLIILAALLIILVYFFVTLPALNYMAPEFYTFLIIAILVYNGLNLIFGKMPIFKTG